MADYDAIRRTIDANIYANGEQKITGKILNDVLNEMVDVQEEFNGEIDNLVENYPNITINGDVTNAPDEEDITSDANNRLKFANRPATNGMGYVILRKNKTFAEQVTLPNTIYEIRYEFDLGGAAVTIPEGCVLKFEGGKLSNGTIVGQSSSIIASLLNIFDANLSISGTWNVDAVFPEWFGAIGNDIVDDSFAIQKALDLGVCQLAKKTYKIENPLIFNSTGSLIGLGLDSKIHAVGCHAVEQTKATKGILIADLSILGDNESEFDGLHFTISCPKLVVRNILVSEFGGWGMYLLKSWDYAIDNVNISYNGNGFFAEEFNSSMLKKIVSFQNNGYGIVIEKSAAAYVSGTIQENKLTGLWLGGCFGCSLNIYGEQNGYEGTSNETKSEIVISNTRNGGEVSSNNFLTYYLLGGAGSEMQSAYGVYLNWASRNVIMGYPAHHLTKEIYCTGNANDNVVLATSLTGSETNNVAGTNKILKTELDKIPTIESKLLQAKNNSTTVQSNFVIHDSVVSRSITFYRAFVSAPEIVITPLVSGGSPRVPVLVSRAATGFVYKLYALDGTEDTTTPCNYIAVGKTNW